jgi:hypothetical protein
MPAARRMPIPRWRSDLTTLPPLPQVQRALVQATEYFAAELRQPGSRAPDWTGFEWSMARAAAVLHGVTPLLAGVLRWRGPEAWECFVRQQRIHTAIRQRRIQALLVRIDAQARRAGVAMVPLKGAALHRLGLYSGGERPMADVDLLVAEADSERARQLLQAVGYLDTSISWRHRVFEPAQSSIATLRKVDARFGEHAERPIKIDLHTRIAERLPLIAADVSGLIFPSAPHPGLNDYPSAAALFTHLLLHAAGNMAMRALRLIQLQDLARLAARMQEQDWAQLLAARQHRRSLWWAVPPLELIALYHPQAIPAAVLASLRPDCPRALRALSRGQKISAVSYTALRIEAFPGIAWSTSMAEKLSYILRRVIPSRELRDRRRTITTEEAWAMRNSWSQMSHGRRMVKWLAGNPLRPPAMHAVRGALEQPADLAALPPPPADACRAAARMP